jgi:hypothetical protein
MDYDKCPICKQEIEILCSGHGDAPFVDGRKYDRMCFICFHVPKIWEITLGEAEDGSEDIWDGPFFDTKHLFNATELVEEGVTDIRARAQKSVTAVRKKCKNPLKKKT